jgi:hypothetical protein
MSLDERWLCVGAPGLNLAHIYGRVDWQDQVVKIIAVQIKNASLNEEKFE